MSTVRLQGLTHLGDIAFWSTGDFPLQFRLSSSFRFDPLAEGLASIKLMELRSKGGFVVHFDFPWQPSDGVKSLGSLRSLFGLCLAYEAIGVFGKNGEKIKESVLSALWRDLQENKGEFVDGERHYVVFREPDTPVPACLGKTVPGKFPSRSSFGSFLSRSADTIRMTIRHSPTEDQITTFLYEAAYNSHEHGRLGTTTEGLIGFRGIIGSRIFQSDLLDRNGFPLVYAALSAFEKRLDRLNGKSTPLLAYTVTDFGRGIQNTLPPKDLHETAEQRLIRAFKSGESRKAHGTASAVGEGLDKMLSACYTLGAFVFVHSAGFLAFADFSDSRKVSMDQILKENIHPSASDIGTAVTVIWPKQPNPDQLSLF